MLDHHELPKISQNLHEFMSLDPFSTKNHPLPWDPLGTSEVVAEPLHQRLRPLPALLGLPFVRPAHLLAQGLVLRKMGGLQVLFIKHGWLENPL